MSGRCEPVGKCPVIGKQQQSFGILIQPPHRLQSHTPVFRRQQLHDGFCPWGRRWSHITRRLMEHPHYASWQPHTGAVHSDLLYHFIHPVFRLRHRLSIHSHTAGCGSWIAAPSGRPRQLRIEICPVSQNQAPSGSKAVHICHRLDQQRNQSICRRNPHGHFNRKTVKKAKLIWNRLRRRPPCWSSSSSWPIAPARRT